MRYATPARAPRPVSPELLARLLAELIAAMVAPDPHGGGRVRVAFDGSDAADPGALADAVAAELGPLGVAPIRVRAGDFLRPASLRLEYGHTDPDAYYTDWLDAAALAREVLEPLGPSGSGRYLPTLWDATADRATRAPYAQAAARAALLLDGPLLLGRGLAVDLSVHCHLTDAALRRRTALEWTLPAFERYSAEVDPLTAADVVVRTDDPLRPAVELPG